MKDVKDLPLPNAIAVDLDHLDLILTDPDQELDVDNLIATKVGLIDRLLMRGPQKNETKIEELLLVFLTNQN